MKNVTRERTFQIDWQEELRSLLSLALFITGAALVLQSLPLGLMVTAALGFHELGHILLIRRCGVPWKLRFGLAGAWVETPLEERQALGQYSNALIHLAGPAFSLLYALAALAIYFLAPGGSTTLVLLANFSAQVGLLNLVPIGDLTDGGKFIQRARASLNLPEHRRLFTLAVGWVAAVYIGTIVGVSLLHKGFFLPHQASSFLIISLWMVFGLSARLRGDGQPQSQDAFKDSQPMTFRQAWWLMVGVETLLLVSTAVVLVTPFWLTQPQIVHIAGSVVSLVGSIFQ